MQLDLGQLRISNEFSWHGCSTGCPKNDPSAVHLDVLRAEVSYSDEKICVLTANLMLPFLVGSQGG